MPTLVHLAPEGRAKAILRSGIAATRLAGWHARFDRFVWAFPILESHTMTHQWARELKRGGVRTLVAVVFRVGDDEPVLVGHYRDAPQAMTAAEATGLIREVSDPLGYEVLVPRRIRPREIVRMSVLQRAYGWRYFPEAKAAERYPCDCPTCLPRGEVKAGRYRRRISLLQQRWEMKRAAMAGS